MTKNMILISDKQWGQKRLKYLWKRKIYVERRFNYWIYFIKDLYNLTSSYAYHHLSHTFTFIFTHHRLLFLLNKNTYFRCCLISSFKEAKKHIHLRLNQWFILVIYLTFIMLIFYTIHSSIQIKTSQIVCILNCVSLQQQFILCWKNSPGWMLQVSLVYM